MKPLPEAPAGAGKVSNTGLPPLNEVSGVTDGAEPAVAEPVSNAVPTPRPAAEAAMASPLRSRAPTIPESVGFDDATPSNELVQAGASAAWKHHCLERLAAALELERLGGLLER